MIFSEIMSEDIQEWLSPNIHPEGVKREKYRKLKKLGQYRYIVWNCKKT